MQFLSASRLIGYLTRQGCSQRHRHDKSGCSVRTCQYSRRTRARCNLCEGANRIRCLKYSSPRDPLPTGGRYYGSINEGSPIGGAPKLQVRLHAPRRQRCSAGRGRLGRRVGTTYVRFKWGNKHTSHRHNISSAYMVIIMRRAPLVFIFVKFALQMA